MSPIRMSYSTIIQTVRYVFMNVLCMFLYHVCLMFMDCIIIMIIWSSHSCVTDTKTDKYLSISSSGQYLVLQARAAMA